MMASPPLNPDLPSSWLLPGIYISLDLSGATGGLGNLAKRILLVGPKTQQGIAKPNAIIQLLGQANANLWFGRGSDIARMYAAVQSQIGGGTADIYAVSPPDPTGGVQANHLATFLGTATAAGAVDIYICGYRATVAIANGDTPAVIAAATVKAINALGVVPVVASVVGGTVWLTARAAGEHGNDLPLIVNFTGASGVKASPGTIALAGTAVGAGTLTVSMGATTVPTEIVNGQADTVLAAKVVGELNLGAYACSAEATGNVVTLLYEPDRVVHRIATQVFTATGITATTATGTQGSGTPSLTATLSSVAAQAAFPCWVSAYTDADSLGAMASHIEHEANGLIQKDQMLFVTSTKAVADAGAIPSSTTPLLTASPYFVVSWCQDAPQQGYELAAREAGRVCIEDYHPCNYDGEALVSAGGVPLLLPHRSSRPDPDELNAAIRSYALTPLAVDEQAGALVIVRDRTTSGSDDERLWAWGTIRTLSFYRFDLNGFLRKRFSKKNLKLFGTPKTSRTVSLTSIADAVYERVRSWDDADLFDGAEDLKKQIRVSPNSEVAGRVDVFVPCRPPVKLDQLSGVASLV